MSKVRVTFHGKWRDKKRRPRLAALFFFFFSLPRLLPPFSTVSFQIFRAQNDNCLIRRVEKRERKEFNYLH